MKHFFIFNFSSSIVLFRKLELYTTGNRQTIQANFYIFSLINFSDISNRIDWSTIFFVAWILFVLRIPWIKHFLFLFGIVTPITRTTDDWRGIRRRFRKKCISSHLCFLSYKRPDRLYRHFFSSYGFCSFHEPWIKRFCFPSVLLLRKLERCMTDNVQTI